MRYGFRGAFVNSLPYQCEVKGTEGSRSDRRASRTSTMLLCAEYGLFSISFHMIATSEQSLNETVSLPFSAVDALVSAISALTVMCFVSRTWMVETKWECIRTDFVAVWSHMRGKHMVILCASIIYIYKGSGYRKFRVFSLFMHNSCKGPKTTVFTHCPPAHPASCANTPGHAQ